MGNKKNTPTCTCDRMGAYPMSRRSSFCNSKYIKSTHWATRTYTMKCVNYISSKHNFFQLYFFPVKLGKKSCVDICSYFTWIYEQYGKCTWNLMRHYQTIFPGACSTFHSYKWNHTISSLLCLTSRNLSGFRIVPHLKQPMVYCFIFSLFLYIGSNITLWFSFAFLSWKREYSFEKNMIKILFI